MKKKTYINKITVGFSTRWGGKKMRVACMFKKVERKCVENLDLCKIRVNTHTHIIATRVNIS